MPVSTSAPERERQSPVRLILIVIATAALGGWYVVSAYVSRSRDLPPTPPAISTYVDCLGHDPALSPSRGGAPLTDVTVVAGIRFEHVVGPVGTYYEPESIGAGAALFDADGDGLLDAYFVNSGRSPTTNVPFPDGTIEGHRLFRQIAPARFEETTSRSLRHVPGYGSGCAAGDVDNDGDVDLFIANYAADQLLLNDGAGNFADVSASAGLNDVEWGTSAAFFDYDRDGWLDLVVVNYAHDPDYNHRRACGLRVGMISYCGPLSSLPTIDRLYHNDGPSVAGGPPQFRDVTEAAGLASRMTYGFGVVCADFTRDGWSDMFITHDTGPNRLWVNQRNGTFLDEGEIRGAALNARGYAEAGMGVAIGDVNQDDAFDLVVTHLSGETTTLYESRGDGLFDDGTTRSGVGDATYIHTGWGAALVDLDHDGLLDLPLVHGLVVPCHAQFPPHGALGMQFRHDVIVDPFAYWRDYADLNVLLMGDGPGRFRDESLQAGDFCGAIASGRGLAYGDVDNDGDVDLLVTNCGGAAKLYRNDFEKRGRWLSVRVVDPRWHRDALGAEVRVRAGGRTFLRSASPASSYLTSHDPRVHFGLGPVDHYDEIIVRWPDGDVATADEVFPGGPVDRFVVLSRGAGQPPEESP